MRKSATQRRSGIQISRVSVLPGKSHIIRIPGEAEDSRFPAAATASTTTTRPRAPPEGCKAAATVETSLVNESNSSSSSNPRVHCQRDPQVRQLSPTRAFKRFQPLHLGVRDEWSQSFFSSRVKGPRGKDKGTRSFSKIKFGPHILYILILGTCLFN